MAYVAGRERRCARPPRRRGVVQCSVCLVMFGHSPLRLIGLWHVNKAQNDFHESVDPRTWRVHLPTGAPGLIAPRGAKPQNRFLDPDAGNNRECRY